jgi:RNA 3'-terminal phosphate cyclase (ATP)
VAGAETLVIDGATGEGGGQIVRSALTLAALLGRPIRIDNLRAGRPKPGLAAQHLTAARAVAALCGGTLQGDRLGSRTLSFHPARPPRAGAYTFDVGEARKGGSAGAVTLVLQAVLPPLALAEGRSALTLRGGTHMAWSPSVDYCREVWLPALSASGVRASLKLGAWGWFPVGRGEVRVRIEGAPGGAGFRSAGARWGCAPRVRAARWPRCGCSSGARCAG